LINVLAPETRRAPHRRSILHYFDEEERLKKKVARGEIKLHLESEGPEYWWQEMWAGVKLMTAMLMQPGFCVLALYLAWVYALVVLVTLVSMSADDLSSLCLPSSSFSELCCRQTIVGGRSTSDLRFLLLQLAPCSLFH